MIHRRSLWKLLTALKGLREDVEKARDEAQREAQQGKPRQVDPDANREAEELTAKINEFSENLRRHLDVTGNRRTARKPRGTRAPNQ